MTSLAGATNGIGAHGPLTLAPRRAHFAQLGASASIRMKMPPTTGRAWKPFCFASVVTNQSESGTREGVSLA